MENKFPASRLRLKDHMKCLPMKMYLISILKLFVKAFIGASNLELKVNTSEDNVCYTLVTERKEEHQLNTYLKKMIRDVNIG